MAYSVMVSRIRSLLKPKTVGHPNYIPFSEIVTDLKPDLFSDNEDNLVLRIPHGRNSFKDSMPRLTKLRNDYLSQFGRAQRIKFLRKLIHEKESHEVQYDSESSEDDTSGFIPAGLAAMLSSVARSTITQTVPGVTIRNRADYNNLKVAISVESVLSGDISAGPSKASVCANIEDLPSTSTSQTVPQHLIAFEGSLSPHQAQRHDGGIKKPRQRQIIKRRHSRKGKIDHEESSREMKNRRRELKEQ